MLASDDGYPFEQPVDPVALDLPDYFDIIKEPMDLSTILKRLLTNHYTKVIEFHKDICLMFTNAHTYNDPDSELITSSLELELVYLNGLYCYQFLTTDYIEPFNIPRKRRSKAVKRDADLLSHDSILMEIDEQIEEEPQVRKRKKRNASSSEEFSATSTHSSSASSVELELDEYEQAGIQPPPHLRKQLEEQREKERLERQDRPDRSDRPDRPDMRNNRNVQGVPVLVQIAYIQAYLRCLYDFIEKMNTASKPEEQAYVQQQKQHYAGQWQQAKQSGQLDVQVPVELYQQQLIRVVQTFTSKLPPHFHHYMQPQLEKIGQAEAQLRMKQQQQQQLIVQQQQQQMMYMQQYGMYRPPANATPAAQPANQPQPQPPAQQAPVMGFGQNSISPGKVLGSFINEKK